MAEIETEIASHSLRHEMVLSEAADFHANSRQDCIASPWRTDFRTRKFWFYLIY